MTRKKIIQKFKSLNVWKRGNKVAPHKPLLVLYAIGKLQRGENQFIPYTEIEKKLGALLREFGTNQSKPRPHYPFWRLREDNVWQVTNANLIGQTSKGDAHITDLKRHNASGRFREVIADHLQSDSSLALEISENMLDHFRSSIHADISQAVGIEYPFHTPNRQRPNPNFRENVLRAYEYKCAVCSFDVKLRHQPVALEAAHIQAREKGGPDTVENGLALCSLHHKLFDQGVFTLSEQLEVLVSEYANGSTGFGKWLMRFHGKKINPPQSPMYYPRINFIDSHFREDFQRPYREKI